MRILKLNENDNYNSGEVLKNFFKDKIDWKLYNCLKDICLFYEDKYSYEFDIFVEIEGTDKYGGYNYVVYDDKYSSGMIEGYAEKMVSDYEINGLLYRFNLNSYSFSYSTSENIQDVEREVFKKLSEKFAVKLVHHLGNGVRFKEVF